MIIDCIGCLHGARPQLDGGDILIITGDLTAKHTSSEHSDVLNWLNEQDYKKKILIAGNHDEFLQDHPNFYSESKIDYLRDSGTEYQGLKIWGYPWSSRFIGINPLCIAYTYFDQTWHYNEHIAKIPHDIDILVTHEPAFGILDGIPQDDGLLLHVGSVGLYGWLKYVARPKLHVFSHIHEGYGQIEYLPTYNDKMMMFVNCSIMNEKYQPVNNPIRVIL